MQRLVREALTTPRRPVHELQVGGWLPLLFGVRPARAGWCLLLAAWTLACAGSLAGEEAGSPSGEAAYPAAQAPAPPPAPEALGDGRYGYSYEESFGAGIVEPKSKRSHSSVIDLDDSGSARRDSGGAKAALPDPGNLDPDTPLGKPGPAQARPLVVYSGFLRLQVHRVLETVDAITSATETLGGYVESLTRTSLVVRVPAKDFEAVIEQFAALGEVLDRRIQAADVTSQFTDLGARVSVAREARSRLLALLEQTKDPKERLQIVAEVKRLTEQIEAIESTLTTLQNLVDFYTVRIELVPLVPDSRTSTTTSPFAWVRNLSALETTLTDGLGDFVWKLPAGFVQFDEADEFFAQSADTALLRAAKLDNDPQAPASFWAEAVDHEMLGRGENKEQSGGRGGVRYAVYASDDDKPRYYLVGVFTAEDELYVIEGFFPNQESYRRHGSKVITSLASFETN